MGYFFQKLVSQFGVYKVFVDNYKVVLEIVEKCSQFNNQFQKILEEFKVKGFKDFKDSYMFVIMEVLLYKFIDWVIWSIFVLYDLLKYIFVDYFDYLLLQDVFCIFQNFLFSINEDIDFCWIVVIIFKGEI